MKWINLVGIFLAILVLSVDGTQSACGQDESAMERRLQKLEEENQQLRDLVKQMQDRMDKFEGTESKKSDKPKEETPAEEGKKKKKDKDKKEDIDKELVGKSAAPSVTDATADIRKKDDSNDFVDSEGGDAKGSSNASWLPSLFGERFQLGGRMQVEYFNSEKETQLPSAITDYPGGGFHLDEFSLYLDGDLKNDVRLFTRVDFTGEDEGLVEGYVDFEQLPLNSRLRAGLQKRFFRPDRYTEYYPLTGIAFWRSRVLGLTLKSQYDPIYAYLSVTNGSMVDDRQLGEDESAKMLSDDDTEFDMNGDKEVSFGLGVDLDFGAYGKLDMMGFGLTGQLSNEDALYLQGNVPGYGFSYNKDKELAGINLDYSVDRWDFFAQAIAGRDGDMERFSWYTELSYKFQLEGLKYLNSIRPLARYGVLDVNTTPQPFMTNGSLTWDREQWLVGVCAEMVRNVNFRIEYALNEEDTGGPDVNNNEILFQLEVRF